MIYRNTPYALMIWLFTPGSVLGIDKKTDVQLMYGCWEKIQIQTSSDPRDFKKYTICFSINGRVHFTSFAYLMGTSEFSKWNLSNKGSIDIAGEKCNFVIEPTNALALSQCDFEGKWLKQCSMTDASGESCEGED